MDKVNRFTKRWSQLKTERTEWENHWELIAKYLVPRKGFVTTPNRKGSKRHQSVINQTPTHYLDVLASTFHSQVTNPSQQWSNLSIRPPMDKKKEYQDYDFKKDGEAKRWIEQTETALHTVLANSNFNQEIGEGYVDFIAFGTFGFYTDECDDDVVYFRTYNVKDFYIDEDVKGRPSAVYMKYEMTPSHLIEKFGEDVPENIKKEYQEGKDTKHEVLHITYKKDKHFATTKLSKDKPVGSLWILLGTKELLKESGFDDFPWAIPRYSKNAGEKYGRGAGTNALKNIIHLNNMEETSLKAAQVSTLPPLIMRTKSFAKPFDRSPSAVNYINNMNDAPKALETAGSIQITEQKIEDKKQEIAQAFMYDIIMMQKQAQMTATEAMISQEERNRILVSVLDRLKNELLRPVINRVLGIMSKKGLLPPVPEHLKDMELDIEFTSPLENTLHAQSAVGIMRWLQEWMPMAQHPEVAKVIDIMDFDQAARYTAKAYNVPDSVLKIESKVKMSREEQEKAQGIAQQQESLNQLSQTAVNVAQAEQASGENGMVNQIMKGALSGQ